MLFINKSLPIILNLTGGTVTGTTTNSGTFNLKNSGVSDFKQSSGTLNITGGGSLALTSATNTITGGTLKLSGRTGDVDLPNVHMDRGYIQYGLGFNKRFGDRFSGFLQAVIRNVGRTGIGLQAGFQWQLGKGSSNDKNQKGNVTPELKKADIKLKGKKIQ